MLWNHISRRILVQVAIDALLVVAATLAAFMLRYDQFAPATVLNTRTVLTTLPVLVGLRLLALHLFHLYRIHWRYLSIHDLKLLVGATTTSSVAFLAFLVLVGSGEQNEYSWGMQIIAWGITLLFHAGVRIAYRQMGEMRIFNPRTPQERRREEPRPRQRAIVVGAGDAGEAVAREFQRRPQDGIVPVGFVDDDPLKRRIRIHGLPVLGTTADIPSLVEKFDADIILVALTNAPGEKLRDIVARCEQTTARLCILPSVAELVDGQSGRSPIRDINIEDLLRRDPVQTDLGGIARYITGQRVLVTGAGGSIGSELCRQIATLNPARLLLVGHGENSIFEIQQELIRDFGFAPTALIGDVKDYARIEEIFLHERPTVVFHAAAHKHVPLMEANPQEAVKNNVLGTRNVATIAAQCGVRKFILVSSDKAVHPVSVMGATKRIGEMIIQSFAGHADTEFAAVRFGNVLGSRGSVIPVLRKQIAVGGPVTVTDPLMTRYFMTIPEAVQLILQAGALGRSGDIFILDMGEPIRILDLARDLIRLSGFRPDIDIKIQFTGIRPGEKLHEELVYDREGKERAHEKIFVARCGGIDRTALMYDVDRLIQLAEDGERPERLREEIMRVAQGEYVSASRIRPKEVTEGVPLS